MEKRWRIPPGSGRRFSRLTQTDSIPRCVVFQIGNDEPVSLRRFTVRRMNEQFDLIADRRALWFALVSICSPFLIVLIFVTLARAAGWGLQ